MRALPFAEHVKQRHDGIVGNPLHAFHAIREKIHADVASVKRLKVLDAISGYRQSVGRSEELTEKRVEIMSALTLFHRGQFYPAKRYLLPFGRYELQVKF